MSWSSLLRSMSNYCWCFKTEKVKYEPLSTHDEEFGDMPEMTGKNEPKTKTKTKINTWAIVFVVLTLLFLPIFEFADQRFSAFRIVKSFAYDFVMQSHNFYPYELPVHDVPPLPNNIIFVKPAKVGGTTMRELIHNISKKHGISFYKDHTSYFQPYKVTYLELSEFVEKPSTLPYIALGSHGTYNTYFDHFAPHAFRITLLRHPIDRAISKYLYHNHLRHGDNVNEYDTSYRTAPGELFKCIRGPATSIYGALGNFHVVGITERFDETLVLMKMLIGSSLPLEEMKYQRLNTRSKKIKFPEELRPEFEKMYGEDDVDWDLYFLALEQFDMKILQLQPFFDEELDRYKVLMDTPKKKETE